jgi:hypothetical protein
MPMISHRLKVADLRICIMNIIKILFRFIVSILSFFMAILVLAIANPPKKRKNRLHEWEDGRDYLKMESFDSVSHKISTGEL